MVAKGQVYVAPGVSSLDDLSLSDLDSEKLLKKQHDERALAEMRRLRSPSPANEVNH